MNIMIIQENGRHDINRDFRECFCMSRAFKSLGHEVDIWGLGHENFKDEPDWESYDLILNFENYDATGWVPNLSYTKNPKKFLWSIDAHCTGIQRFIDTYRQGNYDLILQAILDFVDERSAWLPVCYDEALVFPKSEKTTFIGFCGSILNRKQLLDFLSNKYGLKQDIRVLGEEMVKTVSSYHVHFNINLANDINYRSYETIACETMLLTNYNPQYEMLGFKDGVNCMMYKNVEELCQKIDLCRDDLDLVKKISSAGYHLAKQHTYRQRAEKIVALYENQIGDEKT